MRILILGDSSSAGVGSPQAVYPYLLHQALNLPHRIENHAVPGFTSADAASYMTVALAGRHWDVVIVYLGNNEGACSVYKGTYHRRRHPGRRGGGGRRPPVAPRDRPRLVFADVPGGISDKATTPADFRRNLETVVRAARRSGARVILVSPIANKRFPAALMGPNAPFYKVIGLETRLAGRTARAGRSAAELAGAVDAHERGDLAVAASGYRNLLASWGGADLVAGIAANNLAVLLLGRGPDVPQDVTEEALAMLRGLLGTGTTSSVAACNLARAAARAGWLREAWRYEALAAEGDSDLYRVKADYRTQVAETAMAHPDVELLDLAGLLALTDFVDYCHPTAAGHAVIASALAELLARIRVPGDRDAACPQPTDRSYLCVQPSPHAYFEPATSMIDQYAIAPDDDSREVRRAAASLLRRTRELGTSGLDGGPVRWPEPASALEANVLNTLRTAAEHPVVTSVDVLECWLPEHGHEVGSLPELYLYGLLSHLAEQAVSWGADGLPDPAGAAWRTEANVHRDRIPSGIVSHELREFPPDSLDPARILRKALRRLVDVTALFEDSRANRVMTIRYWYLREALRYGTHSRNGMLYPLWEMENIAEGLYAAVILSRRGGFADTEAQATRLLHLLSTVRDVHERYAARYVWSGYGIDDSERAADYGVELNALRHAVYALGESGGK